MSQLQSRKHLNFNIGQQQNTSPLNPIDKIVRNIKHYSQQNGNLLQKYSQQFYLNYFDRNTIHQTSIKLGQQEHKKQLKLQQFIRRFLSFIQHKQQETLFLAMSLRNLFIKIKEQTNNQVGLKFSDFTNFLCDRIAKENTDLIVPLKQVPNQKINPDVHRVRQIDINPPLVMKNHAESDLPRIAQNKKKKDKKLAERKPVSKFIHNFNTDQIITIGRLSSSIHFYDIDLKKKPTQIIPKTYLDISRQIAILSMDFDELNQRIGVIINGMGIVFWQASDNYETQKTINRYIGQKIFYLKLFKEWITTDKNTIYFWDLKDESVSKKIVHEEAVMVNDVCQINHLRCICVSYTTLDDRKPFIVYKNYKPIARYDMGSTGCHSIHYNIPSQMIIAAGYHNKMEVFEVENKTYSINLKTQLKGHSSIVTCISDIRNTNFILSGDDSGEIRIWELNFMRCIQVVKVSKYINELYCTGEKLIFSDSRLNVMEIDKFSLPYMNDDEIIYQFFDQQTCAQFAVTRKCLRKINFYTGRIEMVYVVCDEQEEILSAIKVSAGVIIGTSKGNMKLYTIEGKQKWSIVAHEGQISAIKYDRKTRFIFSLGLDSKLMIWPQKSLQTDGPKKVLTFKNKMFNVLALFVQVRILFLASTQQNEITVWDYQNLKLLTVIRLNSPVIFMDANTLYRMLLVSTVNDELFFFKLLWKNGYLEYQIVYNGDSVFSGLKKSKTVNYANQINKECPKIKQNEQQGCVTRNKKQKSTKKIASKIYITPQNNISDDIFVTSSKLATKQEKQLKKSSLKIRANNSIDEKQQIQHNSLPYPSIKLIKEQSSHPIHQQTEQMLGTLKSLKKIDNQITTRIEIKNTEECIFLVMGNSKGQITCFDIGILIKEHFSEYETNFKQNQSPNIYRPARQDYEQELLKQKHSTLTLETIKKISKIKRSYFRLVWRQNCYNRQPISCLSFIEMKQIYLCVSMTDGCCKYFDLSTGNIKGDIKLNLPLPIRWDVQIEKDLYIKKNIYETLIVLDSVISNHGFQMLSKEYQAINVTKFLQMLKKKKSFKKPLSKQSLPTNPTQTKKVTLLNEEYSIEDVNHIIHGVKQSTNIESTLKSLEAHKRVDQIKLQMSLQQMNSDQQSIPNDGINKVSNDLLRQKEELQKLFATKYFTVLGEHGVSNKLNQSVEVGSIEERSTLLLQKINNNKKNMQSENAMSKPSEKRLKRQASLVTALPTIQSQVIESMIVGKLQQTEENNLVSKLSNSLNLKTGVLRQKNSSEFTTMLPNCSVISTILKKNSSSMSVANSKLSKLSLYRTADISMDKENKYEKRNLPGLQRSSVIEDKSAREILSQINEKLQRYKKSNYAKRQII